MSSPHVRRNLEWSRGSYALLATTREDVDSAVIFVHGFYGDPESTWFQFQTLIDRCADNFPWWTRSDAFFFSYDSVNKPLRVNVIQLGDFIHEIFPTPDPSFFHIPWNPWLASIGIQGDIEIRTQGKYSRLILVAHSEGAVLVRMFVRDTTHRLLQEMAKDGDESRPFSESEIEEIANNVDYKTKEEAFIRDRQEFAVLDAQLRFFAPAQCGSTLTGFWGVMVEMPGLRGIIKAALRSSSAQVDLKPGSGLVSSLRNETERLSRQNRWISALRAKILWGKDDRIVLMDKFQHDTDFLVEGKDHVSICKPTAEYQEPLRFVGYDEQSERATV